MRIYPGRVFLEAPLHAVRPASLLLCLGLLALAPGRVAALGGRYIDITTSGYAGRAPLTNFPLLVRLSTALAGFSNSQCRPDGSDLSFYDAGFHRVAHEIDIGDKCGWTISTYVPARGGTVTFASVAAGGTEPYRYVWSVNDEPVTGASANVTRVTVRRDDSSAAVAPGGGASCREARRRHGPGRAATM